MDFQSLSRKDLQALCKKNKIPANMTNVAMADALGALHQVEGLDEFLNPIESDNTEQFPDEKVVGTPQIHRTASRSSTRRKPVREEPESSKVSTRLRRGTRAGNAEGNDQENKDLNVPATPAMPKSRTRAPAISTHRKKETHMQEDEKLDVPKTPAALPSTRIRGAGRSVSSKLETTGGTAVQRTRRSVRLLEKSLADMSLMDTEDTEHVKIDEISEEMTNVSQQTKDSAKTEMVSDVGTCLQTASAVDSENTDDVEVTSQEKNIGYECQSQNSQSEMQLGSEAGASLQAPFQEVNCSYNSEQHDSNPKLEVCSETYKNSSEVLECCDESEVEFSNPIEKEVKLNDESVDKGVGVLFEVENSIDFSNPENKFCSDTKQDVPVGASDDASPDVTEQEIAGSLAVSSPNIDPLNPEELVEFNTDNQDEENEHWNVVDAKQDVPAGASDDASPDVTEQEIAGSLAVSSPNIDPLNPEELVEFDTDNQDEENEHWNVVDGDEMLHTDGSHAKLEVRMDPLLVDSEKLEAKGEPETSDSLSDLEEFKEILDKMVDVSENSVADLQPGDIEVKMDHLMLNSENLEARGEPETSDLLCDLEESKEVVEKMVNVSENSVADLQPGDIEVKMDHLMLNSENLEARGEPETSESKEVVEKMVNVSENSVADLQPGDIEVKMDHLMLNSENLEARGEPETSDLLCDLEESKEVVEKMVNVSENSVADLKPGDIEVKMDSLKVDSESLEAKRAFVEESEALVKSDVIPEEIALPKLELHHSTDENEDEIMKHSISPSGGDSVGSVDEVTPSTMTLDSICEDKTSDIPIQSVSANQPKGSFPCLAQSQSKESANEVQTAQKMICIQENDEQKILKMKENLSTDILNGKSIGELRRMFKMMALDAKTSSKSNNGAKQEVERKRTALQALPENRMAAGEAENDA